MISLGYPFYYFAERIDRIELSLFPIMRSDYCLDSSVVKYSEI